jgi:hypothetical protein
LLLLSDRTKEIGSGVEMIRSGAPKSSTIWSAEDDEMLLEMRASGVHSATLQQTSAVAKHQSKLAIPA